MEEEVETIPTGFSDLDEATGIGGLPCGRISELFGADSSGKEALAASLAAQCQKQQGVVAWIDQAGRLDPEQMRVLGVRPDSLLVARPRNELEALEMAVRLARSGGVKLLVFDLVGDRERKGEEDGNRKARMETDRQDDSFSCLSHVSWLLPVPLRASASPRATLLPSPFSLHSSLNLALRRLVAAVHKNRIAFLFITESSVIRHQSHTQHSVLSTQYSKGGQALRYFASVRLEIEKREWIRRGREVVGCRSSVRVVKNKLAAPHREAEVDLWFYRFPQEEPAIASASARRPYELRPSGLHAVPTRV